MNAIKLYTAIFVSDTGTRAANISSEPSSYPAYRDVMKNLANNDEQLVALVPGHHADWSHTFTNNNTIRYNRESLVDPFELPNDSDD